MFKNNIPREPPARSTNLTILSCMYNNIITSNPHVFSEKGSETDRRFPGVLNNTTTIKPTTRFTTLAILFCMFNTIIISNIGIEGSWRCNPHVSSEKGIETARGIPHMFNYIITREPSVRFKTLAILPVTSEMQSSVKKG